VICGTIRFFHTSLKKREHDIGRSSGFRIKTSTFSPSIFWAMVILRKDALLILSTDYSGDDRSELWTSY
jgi:hypothetical protein